MTEKHLHKSDFKPHMGLVWVEHLGLLCVHNKTNKVDKKKLSQVNQLKNELKE